MTLDEKLLYYFASNDLQAVKKLLERKSVDPNRVIIVPHTGDRFTLLPATVERGWNDIAIKLIQAGSDVNTYNAGVTPLMLACGDRKGKSNDIIEALIKAGANLELRAKKTEDSGGETALMFASQARYYWAVKRLLRAGASALVVAPRKRTAIYLAVFASSTRVLPKIIIELRKSKAPLLGCELHPPIFRRDMHTTKLLLRFGCPTNIYFEHGCRNGPQKGSTPLTCAVTTNAEDLFSNVPSMEGKPVSDRRRGIVQILLKSGADPNQPNTKGETPLALAVRYREYLLAKILLEHGAIPDYVPSGFRRESPVEIALRRKMPDFVNLFQGK